MVGCFRVSLDFYLGYVLSGSFLGGPGLGYGEQGANKNSKVLGTGAAE